MTATAPLPQAIKAEFGVNHPCHFMWQHGSTRQRASGRLRIIEHQLPWREAADCAGFENWAAAPFFSYAKL